MVNWERGGGERREGDRGGGVCTRPMLPRPIHANLGAIVCFDVHGVSGWYSKYVVLFGRTPSSVGEPFDFTPHI